MTFFLQLRRCSTGSQGTACVFLVFVTVVLPFVFTYLHLYDVLHIRRCVVIYHGTIGESSKSIKSDLTEKGLFSGIYCHDSPYDTTISTNSIKENENLFRLFSAEEDFHGVPPSIAILATRIEDTSTNRENRWGSPSIDLSTGKKPSTAWDYATPVCASLTSRLWDLLSLGLASKDDANGSFLKTRYDNEVLTTAVNTRKNKFGFRSSSSSMSRQPSMSLSAVPSATYFWMMVNIGLFLLYWQRRVPLSKVALNAQLLSTGDLGRALTGNLSHFDMWHLGMNMMSASALGSDLLERSLGTIPLFLLTLSWIPLTTVAVVALQWIKTRWLYRENAATSSIPSAMISSFPSMVGFSGILFAWMVVATLQTQQKSCPVFFLPDLCFDVYQIGDFTVSVGPLVQLVLMQIVLPRASFIGHLSTLRAVSLDMVCWQTCVTEIFRFDW
jgi:membrane associated rhomboid family serine protease